MIYFDWNATAPLRPEALEAMQRFLTSDFGNPSSIHAAGRAARVALDEAREKVAALLGASEREIVFAAGATEANNLAIQGAAQRFQGARFLSLPVEHPSVLEPLEALSKRGAIQWEKLPLGSEGELAPGALDAFAGAAFAAIMLANNETGRIYDVAAAGKRAAETGTHLHSDLTQAAGRIPVDVRALGLHSGALSAHKLGGPKGIAALYVKRGVQLEKVLFGGKQERSRRPGTENVPAIAGFGAAAAAALRDLAAYQARMHALRERLWAGLRALTPAPVLNTPLELSVPNTLNVSFVGRDGHFLLQKLDMAGLCVSSGAACASGSPEPSPVLKAIGYDDSRIKGAVRFSLGVTTSAPDVDDALKIIHQVLAAGS